MIAYIEELEEMDVSEIHARSLNAKEVLTPPSGPPSNFGGQVTLKPTASQEARSLGDECPRGMGLTTLDKGCLRKYEEVGLFLN